MAEVPVKVAVRVSKLRISIAFFYFNFFLGKRRFDLAEEEIVCVHAVNSSVKIILFVL